MLRTIIREMCNFYKPICIEFFHLDEILRAQLRVKLNACYARLYGLTCDELHYTPFGVDPKEVYGEDFLVQTTDQVVFYFRGN